MASKFVKQELSPKPTGLKFLLDVCERLYPDQPTPIPFVYKDKFLRGRCPLLLIYVYFNEGNPNDIPPHWHYIAFGLSDLHGDGRFDKIYGKHTRNGFGIELTFRLKIHPGEDKAPDWPASVILTVARFVFETRILSGGDFLRFSNFGDGLRSKIQHLLFSEDVQLGTVQTPSDSVTFLQMVGACKEEIEAARLGNGRRVIQEMISVKEAGGPFLITDIKRDKSIFQLDPSVRGSLRSLSLSGLPGYEFICSLLQSRSQKK